ncbi:MAG: pyridoxal-phosphate dependent enzyme [Salibacteraceae bacterium]
MAVKRLDKIDLFTGGNKIFKLKYHLRRAQEAGKRSVLSFGGAYSNHLVALAVACKQKNLRAIGIVRGEECANPSLDVCRSNGMELHFVSRAEYREKDSPAYLEKIARAFPDAYVVKEGGGGVDGIRGAMEILNERDQNFSYIITAVGTGTTAAGLLLGTSKMQTVIGVPVHRYRFVMDELAAEHNDLHQVMGKYKNAWPYHFGGYAKFNTALLDFMRGVYTQTGIKLDPVYTAKALFAACDLFRQGMFHDEEPPLFIHTGGLQGLKGFEKRHHVKLYG